VVGGAWRVVSAGHGFGLAGDLEARLRGWTGIAEEVMRDGLGTVTIGLGAGVIPADRRPAGLAALPSAWPRRA
jgi:hypothetical protein